MERRRFLGSVGLAIAIPVGWRGTRQEPQLPGSGAIGTLRDPMAAGRPRIPTDPRENDTAIQRIERQLACSCGCTLDVFTCRTTDFTCTVSPALHREVMALWQAGTKEREIVEAFVVKYGEQALMAPKPEGFNLAGYLVPGVGVLTAGAVLLAVFLRRRAVGTLVGVAADRAEGALSKPLPYAAAGAVSGPATPAPAAKTAPSPDELERLRRALDEIQD